MERDSSVRRPPKKIELLREAVARSFRAIERRVLCTQARRARAEHLVKCSLMLGRRKVKRKPLKELYIEGYLVLKTEMNGKSGDDRGATKKDYRVYEERIGSSLIKGG